MEIEKAPLNRAHALERRAVKLSEKGNYEESVESHREAVEMFDEVLKTSNNKDINESIRSQKNWNERQIRMLQLKMAYLERVERERKQQNMEHGEDMGASNDLESKIFKSFDLHDSLIGYLADKGVIKSPKKQIFDTIEEIPEIPFTQGTKLPKDDSTVIEELQLLSGQLRESVQSFFTDLNNTKKQRDSISTMDNDKCRPKGLLFELDDKNKEIEQLNVKIKELESLNPVKENLLIQLDDRNKEIEQLRLQLVGLKFEKSLKEEHTDDKITYSSANSDLESLDGFKDDLELCSLPKFELMPIPIVDLSKFKDFSKKKICKKTNSPN